MNDAPPRPSPLLRTLAVTAALLLPATLGLAAPASAPGLQVFFGNLHSHTSYSDGSGTPEEAFRHARRAGLDFLAITEHNHRAAEGTGEPDPARTHIARNHELYTHALRRAADAATKNGQFVALYGQEFSTISAGNHVNVFDVDQVIDEQEVKKGDFAALLRWINKRKDSTGARPILQFNHPAEEGSPDELEYGLDDFPTREAWVQEMGSAAHLIEVLNGPGTEDGVGFPLTRVRKMEREYREYLRLGFHVAPTGNQDNHWKNWGTSTSVRTGVVARSLTRKDILEALRARHTFATTDSNLSFICRVNGQLCGDRISPLPEPGSELRLTYSLRDADEEAASYRIEVWSGTIGADALPAVVQVLRREGDTPKDGASIEDVHYEGGHQFFYFKVIQEGDDKPDDSVWTAPVWLAPSDPPAPPQAGGDTSTLTASRTSAIYHKSPDCRDARVIKPQNRVVGVEALKDRTLHAGCPRR